MVINVDLLGPVYNSWPGPGQRSTTENLYQFIVMYLAWNSAIRPTRGLREHSYGFIARNVAVHELLIHLVSDKHDRLFDLFRCF